MIANGLERAVDLGKELVSQGIEFAKHASEAASSFELLSAGMGNLLRSPSMANSMLDRLQSMAIKSPFQLTELGATAKQLIARGVSPDQVVGRTGQIGDIVSGLGGKAPELDRATLAYGEAMSGDTLNTREINQLTELGVPVWAELKKFTGKTVEELHKMIEKHEISSQMLNKVMNDLTGPDGLFFHGMSNFANTFQGRISSFNDMWLRAERDFGNIVNDWVGDLLQLVNDSPAWQTAHEWFEELRGMSKSVESFISTLPTSALLGKFQPYIESMQKVWDQVNSFIGSFFNEVTNPATGNIETVLNATGDEKVRQVIDGITNMFDTVAKFVTSSMVADLASYGWSTLTFGLEEMFRNLEEIADLYLDIKTGNWGKLFEDIRKYESLDHVITPRDGHVEQSGAVLAAQDKLNSLVTAGASDEAINKAKQDLLNAEKSQKAAPGSAANGSWQRYTEFGPGVDPYKSKYYDWNSYHGIGAYGLLRKGDVAMHPAYARQHYGIGPGQTYTSDKDGKEHRFQDKSGAKAFNNEDFYKGASINIEQNFHITGDSDSIIRVIKERSHEVAKHVHSEVRHALSREAVV
jgi:tape measure domain-containing protein